ncbi:hypothetical protein HY256_06465 [Candidatus Sumerlaeota bacterium]|nr:hypothetical protein [Candidatus Sumerlaeota bacterium]
MSEQANTPPAFKIDAATLYSRSALASALDGLCDVDFFIARLKPKKIFRSCWLGQHLLDALLTAPALNGQSAELPPQARKGGGRRPSKRDLQDTLEPLNRLIGKV